MILRRTLALGALAVALLAVGASPAGAITGNYEEDHIHTYVGLVAFYDEDDEFVGRCSGSLLSATVFITAGHCMEPSTGATHARLWFQQDAGADYDPETETPASSGYPVASDVMSHQIYNYGFDEWAGFPNTHDVAIVILDEPITQTDQAEYVKSYASLVNVGELDRLATRRGHQNVTFTASGYGISQSNPVQFVSFRERLMATQQLVDLRGAQADGYNIQLTANRGNGKGGTCGGDSGGPGLYGATDIVVAVNSFGLNEWCRGVDFMYRLDQADVHSWIRSTIGEARWSEITLANLP